MYEQTKWCLDQLDEINSELPSSFSEQVYTNLGKARKELEASPPNEKDEYIKLQEQYRLSLKTATYFRKEYYKLYDFIEEHDPGLLDLPF